MNNLLLILIFFLAGPGRSIEQQIAEQAEMMFFDKSEIPEIRHTKKRRTENQAINFILVGAIILVILFLLAYYLVIFIINAL